jgi:hypothetical protein
MAQVLKLSLDQSVAVALNIFAVVVGVALKQFLTDSPMIKGFTNVTRKQRAQLYWSALAVLAALILRFFVGGTVHLRSAFVKKDLQPSDMALFFKDLFFLILFGVLIVKIASSNRPAEFNRWLMRFLAAGIIWCIIEIPIRWHSPLRSLAIWWLSANLIQLAVTAFCAWRMRKVAGSERHMFLILAIFFVFVLGLDLQAMARYGSSTNSIPECRCVK